MKLPKIELIVSTPIFTSIKYVEDLLNLRWKIKPTQQQTAKSSSNLAGSTDVWSRYIRELSQRDKSRSSCVTGVENAPKL